MPKSSWASPKAMRGKCERRGGSVNVAAAGTNVIRRAMGARRGRLSAPWLQFHGAGRADVYIIIRVRASRCGESALNPPPSQPIPRRRPSPAPAQRHALPEYFRSPTQPRRPPADCAMHSPPTAHPIPRRRPCSPPHSTHPPRALPLPHAVPTHARRLRDAFPADRTTHSPPKTFARPAQRHALPEHFRSPTQRRRTPAGCAMHARRPHNPLPAAPRCLSFRSASGTKKRHRTVDVRCRMSRSTVVAVGHWGW